MEVYLFYLLFGILFWVIGSIPSGYLIVRLIEGKDVFLAGNGNPGLNNINENFGAQLTVMLGISDLIVKVLIPRFVLFAASSYQVIPPNDEWVVLYGILCVLIGNGWSMFSKFKGGKGVYILFTSLMFLSPSNWIWVLLIPLFSKIFKIDSAPITLLALVPLLMFYWGDSNALIISIGVIGVILLKRVFSSSIQTTTNNNLLVLLNRLLYDRDSSHRSY